ncbi:uncharacterized protein LOC144098373 [Amblyomma americanum]
MRAATLGLALASVLLSALSITDGDEVISFADFRKGIISVNPAKMTPQCRKVLKNCVSKMMALMPYLDVLGQHWDDFSVPCVKQRLVGTFPDYSHDCTRSGEFGQAWTCLTDPVTLAALGSENSGRYSLIMDAQQCAMENSKE